MNRRAGAIAGLVVAAAAMFVSTCADRAVEGSGRDSSVVPRSSGVPRLSFYASRQSDSDLEITGMVDGLGADATGYVRYADLLALPQVNIAIRDDENFPDGTRVSGVALEELSVAVRATASSDLIDASCADRYRTHYPTSYMAFHHPLLGLEVDGQDADKWARQRQRRSPGRYFITHADFRPAFTVLKHADEPQVPTDVIRIHFGTVAATFGAIAPPAHAQTKDSEAGFVIARQNCLRCHNHGTIGGTKAGVDWSVLSMLAQQQTSFFERYVRDPKSVARGAKMPGNPGYDEATLHALSAYFRSLDGASPKESSSRHE